MPTTVTGKRRAGEMTNPAATAQAAAASKDVKSKKQDTQDTKVELVAAKALPKVEDQAPAESASPKEVKEIKVKAQKEEAKGPSVKERTFRAFAKAFTFFEGIARKAHTKVLAEKYRFTPELVALKAHEAKVIAWVTRQLGRDVANIDTASFEGKYHRVSAHIRQGENGDRPEDVKVGADKNAKAIDEVWQSLKGVSKEDAKEVVVKETQEFLDEHGKLLNAVASYYEVDFNAKLEEMKKEEGLPA